MARVIQTIAAAVAVANALPSTESAPLAVANCPEEFGALKPLLARWAKSDDEERTELLARAPRARLESLVTRVKPYFPAINAYLDGFGDGPMPEIAMALASLAQCATEAQLLLAEETPTSTKAVRQRRVQSTTARKVSRQRSNRRG